MRWMEKLRKSIRSWLNVNEANPSAINITETLDWQGNAIKNRLWYRGESSELSQLYMQINNGVDRYKFWASRSSAGMEMRKIHTGLPSLIIDILTSIVLSDFQGVQFGSIPHQDLWDEISTDNKLGELLEKAVKETMIVGDGAFKISIDTRLSKFPILEFYAGDNVEFIHDKGRVKEIVFLTAYKYENRQYILHEYYGKGYVKYELMEGDKVVNIDSIPQTYGLKNVTYQGEYIMAVPMLYSKSARFSGRGQSIIDKKVDCFDALDEAWSQWVDALRTGRAKEYIPESFVPKNPNTGEMLKPNPFDNRFLVHIDNMAEGAMQKVEIDQPVIPHESYQATYITALDLCLQGIISPSTLGMDVKKLDNADAQREKEKATLYTRNKIVNVLVQILPKLAEAVLKTYWTMNRLPLEDTEITAEFGEYANPSFESLVETVGKAKTQGIMSIEAAIEEMYGVSKDNEWKAEEARRIKEEMGMTELEEPALNLETAIIE